MIHAFALKHGYPKSLKMAVFQPDIIARKKVRGNEFKNLFAKLQIKIIIKIPT